MKKGKIAGQVLLAIALYAYLRWLAQLPSWLSAAIVAVFLIPPIGFYTNMGLLIGFPFLSAGIHIYTVILAFQDAWWKAIVTLISPGISQVYWFVIEGSRTGIQQSLYCRILMIYLSALALRFIGPVLFRSMTRETSKPSPERPNAPDEERVSESKPALQTSTAIDLEQEYRRLEALITETKSEEDELRLSKEMEAMLPLIKQPELSQVSYSYREDGKMYFGGQNSYLPPRCIICSSCGRTNYIKSDITEFRCKRCGSRVPVPIMLWSSQ